MPREWDSEEGANTEGPGGMLVSFQSQRDLRMMTSILVPSQSLFV